LIAVVAQLLTSFGCFAVCLCCLQEPVIAHFINDYERNGQYTGFPCLGVEWQKLENPDLRQALLMRVRRAVAAVRGETCGGDAAALFLDIL
jgi:hypothetical protein